MTRENVGHPSINKYFQSLLASRVFLPPSQFETCFLATTHTENEIQVTLEAIGTALAKSRVRSQMLLRVGREE